MVGGSIAGVRSGRTLGVVGAGPTQFAGHGHRRFFVHGIMDEARINCVSRVRSK